MAAAIALRLAREAGFRDIAAAKALRTFAQVLHTLAPKSLTDASELAMYWSDLSLFDAKAKRHKSLINAVQERQSESVAGALAWLAHVLLEEDQERTPVRTLVDPSNARWT